MKIVYTIINSVDNGVSELKFKLVLYKKDWILVNQYKPENFVVTLEVLRGNFVDIEESPLINSASDQHTEDINLILKWDPKNLAEKKDKDGNIYWETKTYWLKKHRHNVKQELREFILLIQMQMNRVWMRTSNMDDSCWEEELEIKYTNTT